MIASVKPVGVRDAEQKESAAASLMMNSAKGEEATIVQIWMQMVYEMVRMRTWMPTGMEK